MKPNNEGKDMWQRAQPVNQYLKGSAQTQDAEGMQVMSVMYMTLLEAVFQQ